MTDRDRNVVYADAELANADWPKKAVWDFPDVTLDQWRKDVPLTTLRQLVDLPVFTAAPDDVREVILGRLGQPE